MGRNQAPQQSGTLPIVADQLGRPRPIVGPVYVVEPGDCFLAAYAISGDVAILLPAAPSVGIRFLHILVSSLAGGTVIVGSVGPEQVNDGASVSLTLAGGLYVASTEGVEWYVRRVANDVDALPALHASTHAKGAVDELDPITARYSIRQLLINSGITTPANHGFSAPPTLLSPGAALGVVDHPDASHLIHATAATTGSVAGMITPLAETRADRDTDVAWQFRTGGSIGTCRFWAGLVSADPSGSSAPTSSIAAFTFDATVDAGSVFWQTYVADGTSSGGRVASTISIGGSGVWRMRIRNRPSAGVCRFYVNDVAIGDRVANLPSGTTNLGFCTLLTALGNFSRNFGWSDVRMLR